MLVGDTTCCLTFFFYGFSSRCWMESAPVTGLHRTPPHLTSPSFTSLLPLFPSGCMPLLLIRRLFSSRPRFCLASPRFASPLLVKWCLPLSPLFFHLSFAWNLFYRIVPYLAAVSIHLLTHVHVMLNIFE